MQSQLKKETNIVIGTIKIKHSGYENKQALKDSTNKNIVLASNKIIFNHLLNIQYKT